MIRQKRKFEKKYCKYTKMNVEFIDYKDMDLVKISLSERGKIMPRRLTGTNKKIQEMLEVAVKRARHMALIPYTVDTRNLTLPAFVKL